MRSLGNRLVVGAWLALAVVVHAQEARIPRVPPGDEIAAARAVVREAYAAEFGAANDAAARSRLRVALLDMAERERDDDASRYVLLDEAMKLAVRDSDVAAACEIVERWSRSFLGLDALALTSDALGELATGRRSDACRDAILERRLALILRGQAENRTGFVTVQVGLAAPRGATAAGLARARRTVLAEAKRWLKARASVDALRAAIAAEPDSSTQNRELGELLCFELEDWRGLHNLAKGDDAGLRRLATSDLSAGVTGDARQRVGDAWWAAAEQHPARAGAMRRRAADCYARSIPGLPASLARRLAERRVETVQQELLDVAAARESGFEHIDSARRALLVARYAFVEPGSPPAIGEQAAAADVVERGSPGAGLPTIESRDREAGFDRAGVERALESLREEHDLHETGSWATARAAVVAGQLLEAARTGRGASAVAALELAGEIACRTGDAGTALACVGVQARRFAPDFATCCVQGIERIRKEKVGAKDRDGQCAEFALSMVRLGLRIGDLDGARRLVDDVGEWGPTAAKRELELVRRTVRDAEVSADAVRVAVRALERGTDSADDRAVVGRYRTLVLGDRQPGLELLKRSESPFRVAAAAELECLEGIDADGPEAAGRRLGVADAWWGARGESSDRELVRARARDWYRLCVGTHRHGYTREQLERIRRRLAKDNRPPKRVASAADPIEPDRWVRRLWQKGRWRPSPAGPGHGVEVESRALRIENDGKASGHWHDQFVIVDRVFDGDFTIWFEYRGDLEAGLFALDGRDRNINMHRLPKASSWVPVVLRRRGESVFAWVDGDPVTETRPFGATSTMAGAFGVDLGRGKDVRLRRIRFWGDAASSAAR